MPVSKPAAQVRQLKAEIQALLTKVTADDDLPSSFASVCDGPIYGGSEAEERYAAYEVEIAGLKLELKAANATARKLRRESSHADVLDDYEQTVARLRRSCAQLRRRNLQLERGAPAETPSARVVRALEATVANLEDENADLRTKIRGLPLAERVAKTQTKVAHRRAQDLHRQQQQLDTERRHHDQYVAKLARLQKDLEDAKRDNLIILQQRHDLLTKLRALRDYVHALPVVHDGPHKDAVADFLRATRCRASCSVSLDTSSL